MRVKIIVEYDGSKFFGWQRQLEQISVQGSIETAVAKVFNIKQRILVEGSGRTDAGVHALGQVAHFDIPSESESRWQDNLDKLPMAINFYLKDSGAIVRDAAIVDDSFHARFSATSRKYRYVIFNRAVKSPIYERFSWHIPKLLDIEKMNKAASYFIGKHNFNAFRASSCQADSPIRSISNVSVSGHGDLIHIEVEARSFLHNQVRIMTGTLKMIGEGKTTPEYIKSLLESKDRKEGGPTAPPHGLFFLEVSFV